MGPSGSTQGELRVVIDRSIVPTLLVDGTTGTVEHANEEALKLMGLRMLPAGSPEFAGLCHPDDRPRLQEGLAACAASATERRFLRLRLGATADSGTIAEVALSGCGTVEGRFGTVLVEMRDGSMNRAHTVFMRLLADIPSGDDVARAMRHGPLAMYPVSLVALYSVNEDRSMSRLCGASGMSETARREFAAAPINLSSPGGVVALTGEHLWLTGPDIAERFPLMAPVVSKEEWYVGGSSVCLPVTSRGFVAGTLLVTFSGRVERSWAMYELLQTLCQSLAPWLVLRSRDKLPVPPPSVRQSRLIVSPREMEVLRLVDEGRTNAGIAEDLGYSEATVRADLLRLSKLLDVHGRRDVVRRAKELGVYPE